MPSAPRLSGLALRGLAQVARSPVGAAALYRLFRADLRIDALATLAESQRGDIPIDNRPVQARPPREGAGDAPGSSAPSTQSSSSADPTTWPVTSARLTEAYASRRATPAEVISRALGGARSLARLTPSVGPVLDFCDAQALREAELSTARYREGKPLGPLDGVPVVIKEETGVRGLPRRSGTIWKDTAPRAEDATVVARLRAAGAIVLGTTPMTEYGMTPTGANPHRVMPQNPHASDRLAGGSSTGSGVAVAAGVCPVAIGCDGGGSIRIPAATNGVFGIKPTWGRVSRHGDSASGTVAHLGPLGASTLDLAVALEIVSGPDAADDQTTHQPLLGSMRGALARGVRGLVIGLPTREWEDASAPVAAACHAALRALEAAGATVLPVDLGLAAHAPAIGYVTIGVEALAALRGDIHDHHADMSHDLQVSLASLACVTAVEYTDAQRLRTGLRREVARAFERVDVLALPTLAETASRVTSREMATGFVDSHAISVACRFNFLGNLTGLPALSCPVGRDADGLPVGLQLVGDAWDEATLLAASAHLERLGVAVAHRPRASVDLL